jgi:hypothetical protein
VDGDGRPDVIGPNAAWYSRLGPRVGASTLGDVQRVAGGFDGDGYVDVIDSSIGFEMQRGTPGGVTAAVTLGPEVARRARAIDFDGDGRLDVAELVVGTAGALIEIVRNLPAQ